MSFFVVFHCLHFFLCLPPKFAPDRPLRLLAKLEPSALAKHAANLVAQISETPQMLVGVLQRLEPSELAEHATGLTKHLKHDKREVRAAALR